MNAQQQLTRIHRGWLKPKQRKAAGLDPERICCTCRYGYPTTPCEVGRKWKCIDMWLPTKGQATCRHWERRT